MTMNKRRYAHRRWGQRWPNWRGGLIFQVIALAICGVFTLPLLFMFAGSLRQQGLPPAVGVEWLPNPLVWQNYIELFQLLPVGRYLLNSIFVTGAGVLLTLISASLAAYGMSRLPASARRWLLGISVGVLLVPSTALWLTRFLIFQWLGWADNYLALLAPAFFGSSPLFILLLYWAFRRIPGEQFEAARLDGANAGQEFVWVALPQVMPGLAAVGMLAFLLYWNDFLNPLLYLKSMDLYTLAIGLRQLQQLDRTNWPLMLAGAVFMTIPVLLVFGLAQRALHKLGLLQGEEQNSQKIAT